MPFALTTACARGGQLSPGAVLDLTLRCGAVAAVLDSTLPPGYFDELRQVLAHGRAELPVWAVENVCPMDRRAAAQLAALEPAEADVALDAAIDTVHMAAELGGAGIVVLLRLGEVTGVGAEWAMVRRAFLRDELRGSSLVEELGAARDARARRHVDGLRRVLERLGREAEACSVQLGIRNHRRFIGIPSPLEIGVLLADLQGAPIVPALDLPAAHLPAVMGLRPLADTLGAWGAAPIALVADACAAMAGLPPGHGEVDVAPVLAGLAGGCRIVFDASPSLDEVELVHGARALGAMIVDRDALQRAGRAPAARPAQA